MKPIKNNEKRKEQEKDIKKKMMMFDKLGNSCGACQKEFDKKNKEMVQSWFVVVREDRVGLYCDVCWNKAQEIIKDFKAKKEQEMKEKKLNEHP